MAQLSIESAGRGVNVEIDGFENMDNADQTAAVQAVIDHIPGDQWRTLPGQPAASDTAQQAATPTAAPDTSYSGALGYGIHGAAEGLGSTMKLTGNQTGWSGLASAGQSVQDAAGLPRNYQPTTMGADLAAGNYGKAFSQLPRAAVESAAPLAATLGAGAVGSLAGPAGTIAGVTAATAGLNAGDNVAARQAANGEVPGSDPTASDLVGGLGTTAVQAGLNVVGLGKAPGVSGLLERLPLAARVPATVGLDAGTGAVSSLATQAGQTVGTEKGLTLDPAEAAAAGLQAGVARAGSLAPGLAKAAVKAGADGVMGGLAEAPASLADAASLSRVNEMFNEATAQAAATKGADTSPQAVMNSLKSQLVVDLTTTIHGLRDAGLMTGDQVRSAKEVLNQARRSNNTITEGGDGQSTIFDDLGAIPGMPEEATRALQDGARDLNTLSTQSFQNNGNGPFRVLGNIAGQVGAAAGLAASGDYLGAGAAAMGHNLTGKMGGVIGGGLDRVLGTNTPPAVLQAVKANAMLRRAGIDNGGSSLASLADVNGGLADIQPQVDARSQLAALVASNRIAAGDYAAASDRDQGAMDRQAARDDASRQAQMDQIRKSGLAARALAQRNLIASGVVQDKAKATTAAQRDGTVDAYLSGGISDPADEVAPVGRQTAQEISVNDQRLRNQATQIKMMAAQQKVLSQAQAGQIGSLAQSKVDAAARSAAVKLAAPSVTPTPRADVPDAAFAAAMAQSKQAAYGVQHQAAGAAPEMDRIAVGLPPSDPVPVGVPLDASGVPLGASSAAPVQSPPDGPSDSQGLSQAPSVGVAGQPSLVPPRKAPWMNFVSNGQGHSAEQIHQAVDAAMADGRISPPQAAALHAHGGDADADFLASHIQPYLAGVTPAYGAGESAAPAKGPIIDPERYDRKVASYRLHAADKMAMAGSDEALRAVILDIRDTPKEADKRAKAAAFIATAPGAEKVRAKMLLSGPLLDAPNS
jgi:hypothetical protein